MACPRCVSGGLGTAGANCRDIADVPPPPKATAARRETGACNACGRRDMLPDTGLPSAGNYGRNVTARAVSDRAGSVPFRRNAAVTGAVGTPPATPPPPRHGVPHGRAPAKARRPPQNATIFTVSMYLFVVYLAVISVISFAFPLSTKSSMHFLPSILLCMRVLIMSS